MFLKNRLRTKSILSFFLFSPLFIFSQRIVEVKYEQDSKGAFVFSCYNNAFCNYILDVGFTVFTNVKSDQPLPFHGEVKPGFNKLFTVTAVDAQAATQIRFNSASRKGCMHPVVNADFTYLLPISPGKSAQVYELSPDKTTDSSFWYVLRFRMKPGDTIYAARKGIVNEIQDQQGENDAGQTSVGTENYIEISQSDCSFARYGILRKNSSLVKPGQIVKAGQPIGLVGGDAYGRGSDLRFSVYAYLGDDGSSSGNSQRRYFTPLIWTKTNGKGKLRHGVVYVSEFPPAVINQEMPVTTPKKSKRK